MRKKNGVSCLKRSLLKSNNSGFVQLWRSEVEKEQVRNHKFWVGGL